MKIKKKNQKPIELDLHLKYRCPNDDCGYYHWLSLKETQTKNFKVVCDCGTIFKPKQISKIKIVYETHKIKNIMQQKTLPEETKTKCIDILCGYGFDREESESLIVKAFENCESVDTSTLIKHAIKQLGEPK